MLANKHCSFDGHFQHIAQDPELSFHRLKLFMDGSQSAKTAKVSSYENLNNESFTSEAAHSRLRAKTVNFAKEIHF